MQTKCPKCPKQTAQINVNRGNTMKHQPTPSARRNPPAPSRIELLLGLATAARDDPDDAAARQRLADAALVHGLIGGARLDPVVLGLVERVADVSLDALRELADAIDRELRRRARR